MDESIWDREDAPQLPGDLHFADDKIEAFLQGPTQYDALGHVWYDGKPWNGYDARTTVGGLDKASVEPIAQRDVVGTGELLDMARYFGVEAMEAKHTFDHTDLLACAERQGVTIDKRDILLIRTNHLQLFFEQGEKLYEDFCEPGLEYNPELVQWFAEMEIPNLVTVTIANEVTMDPSTGTALVLHNALMRTLGIAFTEICDPESLAEACDREGRYKFCYIAARLKIHRAAGSPVNPIALL